MTEAGAVQLSALALSNMALASLAGCLAFLWVLRDGESPWSRRRTDSIFHALRTGAGAYVVAEAMLLWAHAAMMLEQPLLLALPSIGRVAAKTQLGHGSLGGAAAALLLIAVATLPGSRQEPSLVLASLCFAVIAATRSWVSHAGASGSLVAELVDWTHVVGACLWAGAVFVGAGLVLTGTAPAGRADGRDCAAAVQALSTLATWTLCAVVLSGALNVWRVVDGRLNLLLTSAYGVLLIGKLVFTAAAALLGAHNRFATLSPLLAALRAGEPSSPVVLQAFRRTLTWESLAFVAVLGLAAALGNTAPPEFG